MPYHIVVPVMNESENIGPLVAEISRLPYPMVVTFVDDSQDRLTANVIADLQSTLRPGLRVTHFHRTGAMRQGGLSGAVIDGIMFARADGARTIAVMDGDGQHDPVYLLDLFRIIDDGADIAVTSRYTPNGTSYGLDGPLRHLVSRSSALLMQMLFPVALCEVTDPGTGYFAVHAPSIDVSRLHASGFKILLEILVSHVGLSVVETPMAFRPRRAGISKGTVARGVEFLQQVLRLMRTGYGYYRVVPAET